MYLGVRIYNYIYACSHIYVYIYIFTHTHTHTFIYIYRCIYTCIQIFSIQGLPIPGRNRHRPLPWPGLRRGRSAPRPRCGAFGGPVSSTSRASVNLGKPQVSRTRLIPRPPNVPLFSALWSLLDATWGVLKGSWGVAGLKRTLKPSSSQYCGPKNANSEP